MHHKAMADDREVFAGLLQCAIRDAFCSPDTEVVKAAKDWLLLSRKPSHDEINTPKQFSFIYSCRVLGLNWKQLNATLLSANEIDESDPQFQPPFREYRHLRLVQ